MKHAESKSAPNLGDDAVVEVLLAPRQGSFVDALLTLADEAANNDAKEPAYAAMSGGFQAALARRMRGEMAKFAPRTRP
jgi:hypothetical protein